MNALLFKVMSREDKIKGFDPNGLAIGEGLFGLPFEVEDAQLVIIPAPWEVTVSYRAGTAKAPDAILAASKQVDLFDSEIPDAWKLGVTMLPVDKKICETGIALRKDTEIILAGLEKGEKEASFADLYKKINEGGEQLRKYIKLQALDLIKSGKSVALLGGDHSTPLGLMEALATQNESFGILQIDAHCDLREAYEGFTYSHASIMYNALENIPQICKLVQVGIRDFCEEEFQYANGSKNQKGKNRVSMYEYRAMVKERFRGKSWDEITDEIIADLPDNVYVSFDIDGLNPTLCPNTGTPVAGGMSFEEVMYLIEKLTQNDKKIIGFDLNEVGVSEDGSDWDANVGARVLYRLCNYLGKSQGLI